MKPLLVAAWMLLAGAAHAGALRDIANQLREANFQAERERSRRLNQEFRDAFNPPAREEVRITMDVEVNEEPIRYRLAPRGARPQLHSYCDAHPDRCEPAAEL